MPLGGRTSEAETISDDNENSIDSERKSKTPALLSDIEGLLNKSQSYTNDPKSHFPYRRNDSGFVDSAYGSDDSSPDEGQTFSGPVYQTGSRASPPSSLSETSLPDSDIEHDRQSSDSLSDSQGDRSDSTSSQSSGDINIVSSDTPYGIMPFGAGHDRPVRNTSMTATPTESANFSSPTNSPDNDALASYLGTRLKDIGESDQESSYQPPAGPFLHRGPDYSQLTLKSSRANSLQRTASIHGRPQRRCSGVRSSSSGTSSLSCARGSNNRLSSNREEMQRARDQYYEDPYADTSKTDLEIYEEYSRSGIPRSSMSGIISPISPQMHTGESTGVQKWTNEQTSSVSSRSNARSYIPSFLQNRRRRSISSRGTSNTGKSRLSVNWQPSISYITNKMNRWKNNLSSRFSRTTEDPLPRRKASDVEAELYGNISQKEARRRIERRYQSLRAEGTRYFVPREMQEWISQLPMDSKPEPEKEESRIPSISLTSVNDEVDDWFRSPSFDQPSSGSSRTGVSLEDALSRLREERRIKDQQLAEYQSQDNVFARYWGSHTEEGKYDATEDEQDISILRSQISTLRDRLGELESRFYQF
ncbi:hypothetical protein I203_107153 [Kwoniella mangroviensis CBS 8507]|uniref:hypothetical protein n=1 Tax=Kwoniella mangroviensis CBS 8507 TaxID=1296122 RepID=UPI00080D30F3|nr:uncharacterized protein I203_01900 [Kwoniella mangroviensis CBS 8507]OCF68517.1 hypothetical protein I203_01900 [Kwoniella mangroviensis CBS 8507]